VRRDCEPHRGHLLLWLGYAGAACGLLSCLFLPGILAVALGIAVEAMAKADLARMRQGQMDPAGKAQTERGRYLADLGGALGALVGLPTGLLWFLYTR
jgi:hypothetical protein